MKERLLGKKRQTREEEDEEREIDELTKTKEEKKEKNNNNKQESEEAPNGKASLFGNTGISKKIGLFGNLTDNKSTDNKPKLFNTGESNKFHGSSLFGNTAGSSSLFGSTGPTSLFGSAAGSSLFSSKTLFNFNSIASDNSKLFTEDKSKSKEEKSDNEEDDNEDDQLFQSNSPNPYNPLSEPPREESKEKNPYTKKYIKEIENIYVYSKDNNKFSSKGRGFLSLEYAEIESKKVAVAVFRNTVGNKIVEGFLAKNIKKFEKYVKNFKHVVSFSFLSKGSNGKFEIGFCKVPFIRDNELKEFEKAYNDIIDLLDDQTADTKSKSEEKEEKKEEKIETTKADKNQNITKSTEKK